MAHPREAPRGTRNERRQGPRWVPSRPDSYRPVMLREGGIAAACAETESGSGDAARRPRLCPSTAGPLAVLRFERSRGFSTDTKGRERRDRPFSSTRYHPFQQIPKHLQPRPNLDLE